MEFLEKDLEDIIYDSDLGDLDSAGLFLQGKCYRQLRVGNYGYADLVYFQRPYFLDGMITERGSITIVELKKGSIGEDTFFQAIKYALGIRNYLYKNHRMIYDFCYIKIILVGRTLDLNGNLCYLPTLLKRNNDMFCALSNVKLYTYKYTLHGLTFEELVGYSLNNEDF